MARGPIPAAAAALTVIFTGRVFHSPRGTGGGGGRYTRGFCSEDFARGWGAVKHRTAHGAPYRAIRLHEAPLRAGFFRPCRRQPLRQPSAVLRVESDAGSGNPSIDNSHVCVSRAGVYTHTRTIRANTSAFPRLPVNSTRFRHSLRQITEYVSGSLWRLCPPAGRGRA